MEEAIVEILERYPGGIKLSNWSLVETFYQRKFNKSLDYNSFGVANKTAFLNELNVMGETVVSFKRREDEYVMFAPMAKFRRMALKPMVEKVLFLHGAKIVLDSFDKSYKDVFKSELCYGIFGLTDRNDLCKIFEDVVVEKNSAGVKEIKAVKGYNLRSRSKKRVQFKKKEKN